MLRDGPAHRRGGGLPRRGPPPAPGGAGRRGAVRRGGDRRHRRGGLRHPAHRPPAAPAHRLAAGRPGARTPPPARPLPLRRRRHALRRREVPVGIGGWQRHRPAAGGGGAPVLPRLPPTMLLIPSPAWRRPRPRGAGGGRGDAPPRRTWRARWGASSPGPRPSRSRSRAARRARWPSWWPDYEEMQRRLGKTLSGLLPVCAWCKRIKDGEGQWTSMEAYVRSHSSAEITHGMCADCAARFDAGGAGEGGAANGRVGPRPLQGCDLLPSWHCDAPRETAYSLDRFENQRRRHGAQDPGHREAGRGPGVEDPSEAGRFRHRHRRGELQAQPLRRDRRRGGAPAQGGPRRRGGGGLDRRREEPDRDPRRPRHGGRPRRARPPRRPARPGGGLGAPRQALRAGEAGPGAARQAVDRRRPEPGRPVPGGAPRLAAGHLRLQDREPGERGRAEEAAGPEARRRRQGAHGGARGGRRRSRRSSSRCRRW